MSGNASIFASLNESQRLAAETTEGPVEVIAGAGTGKTRALVARYCHLVKNLGIPPASILCATFTNRAANEMKKRVRAEVGDLDLGRISTIHAFCVQFLRDEIDALGFPKDFVILDVDDDWMAVHVETPKGGKDLLIRMQSIERISVEKA